ncbi:MAG TPA: hypothetical protein DDY74_01010 [Pseudothermotoga sp.]|nr:hypothetical protein [Pseudothermotoga sp.]
MCVFHVFDFSRDNTSWGPLLSVERALQDNQTRIPLNGRCTEKVVDQKTLDSLFPTLILCNI